MLLDRSVVERTLIPWWRQPGFLRRRTGEMSTHGKGKSRWWTTSQRGAGWRAPAVMSPTTNFPTSCTWHEWVDGVGMDHLSLSNWYEKRFHHIAFYNVFTSFSNLNTIPLDAPILLSTLVVKIWSLCHVAFQIQVLKYMIRSYHHVQNLLRIVQRYPHIQGPTKPWVQFCVTQLCLVP